MKANTNGMAVLLLVGALLGSAGVSAETLPVGGKVYEKVCGHCHDAGVGPVIKGRNLPVAYVEYVVRNGNRAMPSFRPTEIDRAALGDVALLVNGGTKVAAQAAQ